VDPNILASREWIERVDAGTPQLERECPYRHTVRPHTSYNVTVNGQLMRAKDYNPHRRLQKRRCGAAGQSRARDRQHRGR